jgi:hypothetical protein
MTRDEFVNSNKNADVIVNFFNVCYSGKEYLVDAHAKKKGIIMGLNKHLLFMDDQMSPHYSDIRYIGADVIPRVKNITYAVAIKVPDLPSPELISFELFMQSKKIIFPDYTRSYKIA